MKKRDEIFLIRDAIVRLCDLPIDFSRDEDFTQEEVTSILRTIFTIKTKCTSKRWGSYTYKHCVEGISMYFRRGRGPKYCPESLIISGMVANGFTANGKFFNTSKMEEDLLLRIDDKITGTCKAWRRSTS